MWGRWWNKDQEQQDERKRREDKCFLNGAKFSIVVSRLCGASEAYIIKILNNNNLLLFKRLTIVCIFLPYYYYSCIIPLFILACSFKTSNYLFRKITDISIKNIMTFCVTNLYNILINLHDSLRTWFSANLILCIPLRTWFSV